MFLLAVMKKSMTKPMLRTALLRWKTWGKTSSRLLLEPGKDLCWPLDTVLTVQGYIHVTKGLSHCQKPTASSHIAV